jgi:hypothetical protein
VFADKYRVDGLLGNGGMGIVFAATHLQLETRVAIKLLRAELTKSSQTASARLLREARATAKIKSDYVARVLDIGMVEWGGLFIVMEHLDGMDLEAFIRTQPRLAVGEAVGYLMQACEGVRAAHALGIIHRDLKPSNLFLAKEVSGAPRIKVLDFGVSKLINAPSDVGSTAGGLTGTNSMLGSPVYMSPEQLTDPRSVDVRADIWSLGMILFELLTGRRAFEASTMPQLGTLILHGKPESVRTFRPELPAGLAAIIDRCLQRDPADRYSSVRALMGDLAKFAPQSTVELTRDVQPAAPHRSIRWPAVAAMAGGLLLAFMLFALAARIRHTTREVSRPVVAETHDAGAVSAAPTVAAPTCGSCVARNCSSEYQACQSSRACRQALAAYNGCVDRATDPLAAACTERLGTARDLATRRLSGCVFARVGGPTVVSGKCVDSCSRSAIGDASCEGYCDCMARTCATTLDAVSCRTTCAALKPQQIRCRTFHCFLALKSEPEVHCQHAVGHLGMCP